MSEIHREHLAALAAHFRDERETWPDLWHSMVLVRDSDLPISQIAGFWLETIGEDPENEEAARWLERAIRAPSLLHSRDRLTGLHYFAGEGGEAFASLARFTMRTIAGKRDWLVFDRDLAHLHWLELVYWSCRIPEKGDDLAVARSDADRGLFAFALRVDVFTASGFSAELAMHGIFPAPIRLNPTEQRIVDLLENRALTADRISELLHIDRRHLLKAYISRDGSLRRYGVVRNNRKFGGYYRPDAPPPSFKGKS